MRSELHRREEGYPARIRHADSPPDVLYGIGDIGLLEAPTLGVIGARKATPYGLKAARMFAGWAAGEGFAIVSGAAMGCDQAAHRAAIEADGTTIAILGCGCDVDYPSGAATLLDTMRRDHLVVSEREWGAGPVKWAFRRRNRLIAAISDHLLVVEAALPSGTFSTVDYASNGNSPVLVVPGSIFSPGSRGCNRLILQGAHPVCDVADLAEHLGAHVSSSYATDPSGRSTPLNRIHAAVLADPMRPDDIAHELALDIVTVARSLSGLEREGRIMRYRDGRYGPG